MTHQFYPQLRAPRRHIGFTMIEIITVLVIIILLMAIALPVLSTINKKMKNTRAAADLASIGMGLEAYRTDFGDYPRPGANNTGFAVLTKALISPGPDGGPLPALGTGPHLAGAIAHTGTPGPGGNYQEYVCFAGPDPAGGFATSAPPTDATQWANFPVSDGKDGPGFRARAGSKTYGPYLQPEKFRLRGLAILDSNENPILYFVARPSKPVAASGGEMPMVQMSLDSLYNATQNLSFFLRPGETVGANGTNALKRLEAVLITGDNNYNNGFLGVGEAAATDKSFLLWSAGADRNFGVTYKVAGSGNPTKDDVRKCDDVTNFTTGQ